ncbi:MAG: FG-GAP repeat protein, partial [Ardenticatenales bacterium]|nr:FG-GAP repeat protein [Ardenticatenales bacterium]
SILWEHHFQSPINSSPAIGDIDGNGTVEIVVGLGAAVDNIHHTGGVVALNANGDQLWHYQTHDQYPSDGHPDAVYSSPALCQLDGDPQREIVFGSWDQRIHAADHLGNPLWANINWPGQGYFNADTIWSSASCVDFNGDGIDEVVIGADIALDQSGNGQEGGFLYVFNAAGQPLVRRYVPETIYSSPAIADLDCDGSLEIVVGTGDFYYYAHGQTDQPFVYVFNSNNIFSAMAFDDPNKLPDAAGWPQPTRYPGMASPSLADLDNDGDLEITILRHKRGSSAPNGCNNGNGDCYAALYAWHHNGQSVAGFPVWPKDFLGKNAGSQASTTIANIDNDPTPEILLSMMWDVIAIGANGQTEHHFTTQWTVSGTAAVDDTDGDGSFDLWIGSGNQNDAAHGYLWQFDLPNAQANNRPWAQFRQSANNSGRFPFGTNLQAHATVPLHDPSAGPNAQGLLSITNLGPLPADWQVVSAPSRVSVNVSAGQLQVGSNATAPLTINTTGLGVGTHNLGNIHINSCRLNCSAQQQLSAVVPVTVRIAQVSRIHLPIIGR